MSINIFNGAKLVNNGGHYELRDRLGRKMDDVKLSLPNCQAIALGYDLDELAESFTEHSWDGDSHNIFKAGFQKALDILGDRQFTKEDLEKSIIWAHDKSTEGVYLSRLPITDFIQSLQQTEWEIDVEMKPFFGFTPYPRLDADGCIILRRI